MNIPLFLYRLSGWTITFVKIFVAFVAIKEKKLWKDNYKFLGYFFILSALIDIVGAITALLNINNLFLDYIYIPISFALKALYLLGLHRAKLIHYLIYSLIFVFVVSQIFVAIDKEGYKTFDSIGSYLSSGLTWVFTTINLSLIISQKSASKRVRINPDFWFTATMLCISFLGLISTFLIDTSYIAQSEIALYGVYISGNFIKAFLYLGYYRGIRLFETH